MPNYPMPPKDEEINEQDCIQCGSGTDCTGLIPSAVLSDDEMESYEELYSFLPPKPDKNL